MNFSGNESEVEEGYAAMLRAGFAAADPQVTTPVFEYKGAGSLPEEGSFIVVICEQIELVVGPLAYGWVRVQVQTFAMQEAAAAASHKAALRAVDAAIEAQGAAGLKAALLAASGDRLKSESSFIEMPWRDLEDEKEQMWISEKRVKVGLESVEPAE